MAVLERREEPQQFFDAAAGLQRSGCQQIRPRQPGTSSKGRRIRGARQQQRPHHGLPHAAVHLVALQDQDLLGFASEDEGGGMFEDLRTW